MLHLGLGELLLCWGDQGGHGLSDPNRRFLPLVPDALAMSGVTETSGSQGFVCQKELNGVSFYSLKVQLMKKPVGGLGRDEDLLVAM